MNKRLCLKCCPRCRGDMVQESELDRVPYYTCIQCGHSLPADELARLLAPAGRSRPLESPLPRAA